MDKKNNTKVTYLSKVMVEKKKRELRDAYYAATVGEVQATQSIAQAEKLKEKAQTFYDIAHCEVMKAALELKEFIADYELK